MNMTTTEILTIIAIILGPIIAVQVDRILAKRRDTRNRKLSIFKTLMATRGSILSFNHVEALNRIDLESQGTKHMKIIRAWKEYFDELCNGFTFEQMQSNAIPITERRQDLLANLLVEMGTALGYDFDKVLVKRNAYTPKGHTEIENQNDFIRKGMIKILEGNLSLPINIEAIEVDDENRKAQGRQAEMQDLIIEYYKRENKKYGEPKRGD